MLVIRLQRLGKKKQPTYRLVVSEKTKDTQANSLEILGHYNPIFSGKTLELKEERIKYWLSKGAQASDTVHNLLVKAGVVSGDKKKVVFITKRRQIKINEKTEANKAVEEDKKVKAKEAAKAKAEEVAKTEETPVEEKVEEVKKEEVKEEAPAEEVKEEIVVEEKKEE
ncbi:30S ribosomal protein S16 [Patescibacteria group bacterium]|nr:30S ribosomal protein S16 [Patescibacteria group bacterium]